MLPISLTLACTYSVLLTASSVIIVDSCSVIILSSKLHTSQICIYFALVFTCLQYCDAVGLRWGADTMSVKQTRGRSNTAKSASLTREKAAPKIWGGYWAPQASRRGQVLVFTCE